MFGLHLHLHIYLWCVQEIMNGLSYTPSMCSLVFKPPKCVKKEHCSGIGVMTLQAVSFDAYRSNVQ